MNALDLRWIIPALGILCIEYFAAFRIGVTVGFHYQIPFQSFALTGSTVAAIGLALAMFWQLFCLWREGEDNPARRILGRLPWSFVVGVLLVACQVAVLNWTKVMMPLAVGFWADPIFASLDHLLFGQDPWHFTHLVLGDYTQQIDRLYALWGPIKFTVLLIILCCPASGRKAQALTAYFLVMACGALGQYLGASAGPIFYGLLHFGDRFQDIPVGPWGVATRDYLWSDYLRGGGRVGGGISAMPSMHVAIALWMALANRAFLPRLQIVSWAYFLVILVGSVHLGWHYAVDGLVACAFTLAAWWLAASVPILAKAPGRLRPPV
jgi:hypothetical protein